jgi:hypothetical protein
VRRFIAAFAFAFFQRQKNADRWLVDFARRIKSGDESPHSKILLRQMEQTAMS